MSNACATLARVTDRRDPSPAVDGGPDRGLSADELAAVTGGRLLARSDRPMLGGAVDSREVRDGNLFVALPGERTDGHRFVAAALAAGAAGVLLSTVPDDVDPAAVDATIVGVPDPLEALQAVASAWRLRYDPLVVGVTGSIARPWRVPAWLFPVVAAALALGVGALAPGEAWDAVQPLVEPIAFLLLAVPLAVGPG